MEPERDELTSLLIAARDGDRVALGAFIRSTQAEVWRMARHLVGTDDAEDVTQDVFVRVWRAVPSYRGDAAARTWLYSIARRACADAVRRRTRVRRLRARLESQPRRAVIADPTTEIDDLISVLAPDQREAFVLTQVLGCSYEEAALVAGIPVGAIRSRVSRAREALVEAMRAAEAMQGAGTSRRDATTTGETNPPSTRRRASEPPLRPFPCAHRPRRAVGVLLLTVAALVAAAVPAVAHVTVKPGEAPKGSFSVLSFSVPNERSNASTVKVEVTFPVDHPIPYVSVQPTPGWTWAAERTTLAKPIEAEGGEITDVVSKITWTGSEIKPGEFQLFTISAGPLPTNTKQIEFKALQTYSDGEVVRWIESTPKGGPEPELPAPVLKLVGKTKGH